MFLIMGLVILVTLVVIVGLFYFNNKEGDSSASAQVVPIVDVTEFKKMVSDEQKNIEADTSFAPDESLPQRSADELDDAKVRLAKLEQNIIPKAVLSNEVSSNTAFVQEQGRAFLTEESRGNDKVRELEAQVAMISQKAIEQAEEAVKAIEHLMKENAQLKMNQNTISNGFNDAQSTATYLDLKEKNALIENQLEVSSSKAAQLESQISVVRKELGQQLLEANSIIARLKVESEAQERIMSESLHKANQELDELRSSNFRQNKEMEEGYYKAKEENLLFKDAKKLLEAKLAVIEDDYKKELDQAKEMVSSLVNEKNASAEQSAHLEQDVRKLKELNNTLIDRAKILQYELNRHRAQASGLERVCGNFKVQMEDMFQQIEQTKRDNNRLLQERINLEAGVVSLRTENSKLAERDKTYQQELEKTKEQIIRFEKIYKNFKNNVGDISDDGLNNK